MKTKLILAVLAAFALNACDSTSSNEAANNDNGGASTVGLRGSVLDPSGRGIPNAKVRLKSTGAVAITDANGKWSITSTPTQGFAGRALASTDSIVVSKDSQVIAAKPVVTYNAELPPMYIVQRDIFGTLLEAPIGKSLLVSAIVDMPDSSKYLLNFWYNKTAGSYSKFFYLLAADTIQTYRVSLVVRDSAGDTLSKSKSPLEFTTEAGDVQLLPLRYNNFTPKFTFNRDSLKADDWRMPFGTTRPIMKTVMLNLDSSNYDKPYMYEWKVLDDTVWTITDVPSYTFNAARANATLWEDAAYNSNAIKVRVTCKNRKSMMDSTAARDMSWN